MEGDREDSERERHERMEKERMLIEPARIGLEREKIEKQHVLILKWKINTRNTSMTLCLPLLPFLTRNTINAITADNGAAE